MEIDSDYKEALRCFVEVQVRFLVVSGYAVIKHSEAHRRLAAGRAGEPRESGGFAAVGTRKCDTGGELHRSL